jgi:hypothetical protein
MQFKEFQGNKKEMKINKRHDTKQGIDRDGQEVAKKVQAIQINPKIKQKLPTGNR